MEYKVYGERKREVVLKLVRGRGDLAATLIACDYKGNAREKGELLSITKKGELVLHSGISEDLGLVLDIQGRLAIPSALMSNMFSKAIDEVTRISELDDLDTETPEVGTDAVSGIDDGSGTDDDYDTDDDYAPVGIKDNKANNWR